MYGSSLLRSIGAAFAAVALVVNGSFAAEAGERSYGALRTWLGEPPQGAQTFSPGEVITSEGRERLEPFVPISAWEFYFYDGMEMEIAEARSYPLPDGWGASTGKDLRLDDNGVLQGFAGGGFPFPDVRPDHERAAEKVIWNMIWRPGAEDYVMPMTAWSRGPGGRLDREIQLSAVDARYAKGHEHHLVAGEEDVRVKNFMEFRAPRDIAGTKLLTKKYADHYQEDGGWMYSPQQRKPRRILASERTGEMLGMDWTQEDLMGFGGKVHEHRWTHLGMRKVLATMNLRDNPDMGGPHQWVPHHARWELRDAHVLLVEPKSPAHPYAAKVLFVDAEHFWTLWMFTFDREEKQLFRMSQHFLKYGKSYANEEPRQAPYVKQDYSPNAEAAVFLHVGETDINARKAHATITHCYTVREAFSAGRAKQFFSLRNMVGGKR
jgi:hypothetical protein